MAVSLLSTGEGQMKLVAKFAIVLASWNFLPPIDAAAARYWQDTKELKRQWLVLEDECRGGAHTPDDAICTERDRILTELQRRGICWIYSDWRVFPSDYHWHPCSQAHPKGWRPK
jgi:hypothetical protein